MSDEAKPVEVVDPRTTAADDAAKYADLLVAAALRRTNAAMTPGEVAAALLDTKSADAAVLKATADKKTASDAILAEETKKKVDLAVAEATAKAQKDAAEANKPTDTTTPPVPPTPPTV